MADLEKKFSLYNSDGTESLVIEGSTEGIEKISGSSLVDTKAREDISKLGSGSIFVSAGVLSDASVGNLSDLQNYIYNRYKEGDRIVAEPHLIQIDDSGALDPTSGILVIEVLYKYDLAIHCAYTFYSHEEEMPASIWKRVVYSTRNSTDKDFSVSKDNGWRTIENDGSSVDLSEYAKTTDVPTKLSQLTDDTDFVKSVYVPADVIIDESSKRLFLVNYSNVKLGNGIVLPSTSGSSDADAITIKDESNHFTSTNVEGALNELFQSVSNGKNLIATAITDKGIATSSDDAFQTMATNIGNIIANNEEGIPSYHYIECGRIAKKILDFKNSHNNSLVIGVVSDNHIYINDTTYGDLTKKSTLYSAFALENVGTMVECDFVANLGDSCWESTLDTENAYEGSLYVSQRLKLSFDRLTHFSLVGNHDKTNNTQRIFNLIGQYNDFDTWATTQIRSYGYKDFTDKKVRVICLNTCDYLNASGGCGMSYEQKDFLMRALDLSGKSDYSNWQILILSHIPLDWNGGDYNFYTDLQTILNAYVNGTTATITVNNAYALNETPSTYTTYSNGKLIYNYSGKNSAKIIANIHGHIHNNAYKKMSNNLWRIATPNACFYQNKDASYPDYGDYGISTSEASKIAKVANSAKDTSATFYCIDLSEKIIYAYGYGANTDRIISYKEIPVYTITNNLTNVTTNNTNTSVTENGSYSSTIIANNGYELGAVTVTMGGVDITSSAYSNGQITINQVTGNIVITAIANIITSYTNIINNVGTVDNVRLRSGGNTAEADGFASNYFPVSGGDIIRVYFPNGNRGSIPSNGVYCCTYSDTNGTLVTVYDGSTSSVVMQNLTDTGYEIHIPSDVNCSYARVAGGAAGQHTNWVVTVNELIE